MVATPAQVDAPFSTAVPMLFLLLAALALIGGALYPPTNIDTNAYRIPRVLHWLGQGQWHWFDTYDPPQNRPGLRFRMAGRSLDFIHANGLAPIFNQLGVLSDVTGADFQ